MLDVAAARITIFHVVFLSPPIFISRFLLEGGPTGWFIVGVREYEEDEERVTESGACAVLEVARRRDGELEGDSASRR